MVIQTLARQRRSSGSARRPATTSGEEGPPLMSTDTAPEVPADDGTTTDNVRWFAELGLADLEVVGGKNASLGEMISQPRRRRGAASPTGSPPRPRPTSASSATPAWPPGSPTGCAGWTPTTSGRCPRPAGRSAARSSSSRSRRPWRPTSGRPTSSWPGTTPRPPSRCGPAPPPRTCPTPPSPASRRPSSTCAASTRCCRPSGRSTPRSTTTGPSPTGCTTASTTSRCRCRRACSGWCARTSGPPG